MRVPAAEPEVPRPDDARFVLRQAGWQGELFLGVKLLDPTWTRERWDHAQDCARTVAAAAGASPLAGEQPGAAGGCS